MANATLAFEGAGQVDGLEVWRVEKFRPVRLAADAHGLFYNGDSYVLLCTKREDSDSDSKSYDLHFWLGESTSQDEAGAAAVLAVELDSALGGKAKQFRQVQGSESQEFLELFANGVHYRTGGVSSGFRHVEENKAPPPALYRVKGAKNARLHEVPMDYQTLTSGDVFILDLYNKLMLWSGRQANVAEKAKAREVLAALQESRKGQPEVVVIEEGEMDDAAASFYATLGAADPNDVQIAPAQPDLDDSPQQAVSEPRLYKVVSEGSDLEVAQVSESPLRRSLLQTEAVFLLAADSQLYIWQGRQASSGRKDAGLAASQELLQQLKLPKTSPVQLVKEGLESSTFRQHFDWMVPSTPEAASTTQKHGSTAPETSPESCLTAPLPASAAAEAPSPASSPCAQASATPGPKFESPVKQEASLGNSVASPKAEVASALKDRLELAAATSEPPAVLAQGHDKGAGGSGGIYEHANGKINPQEDGKISNADGGQEDLHVKPSLLSKSQLLKQDAEFIPKPKNIEPILAPKPPENLKFRPHQDVFPLEELKEMRAESGIDMTCKEAYLSAEEFQKVFGKTLAEFQKQPKWRQLQAKKTVGLF